MKVVYVAGPYRGANAWEIEGNIRRAEALALEVWKLGAACLCPHTNSRFFQDALPDRVFLEGDLELLRRCDAILLTLDWRRSDGACTEHIYAINHGIVVCYNLTALARWLHENEATA